MSAINYKNQALVVRFKKKKEIKRSILFGKYLATVYTRLKLYLISSEADRRGNISKNLGV